MSSSAGKVRSASASSCRRRVVVYAASGIARALASERAAACGFFSLFRKREGLCFGPEQRPPDQPPDSLANHAAPCLPRSGLSPGVAYPSDRGRFRQSNQAL